MSTQTLNYMENLYRDFARFDISYDELEKLRKDHVKMKNLFVLYWQNWKEKWKKKQCS